MTHGDRRATETRDLSRFNIDNKYGKQALENVIRSLCNIERPWAPFPKIVSNETKFDFVTEVRKALIDVGLIARIPSGSQTLYAPEKGKSLIFLDVLLFSIDAKFIHLDFNNISRFLNRILGTRVQMQNSVFRFFSDVLNSVLVDARRSGSWDMGILGQCHVS